MNESIKNTLDWNAFFKAAKEVESDYLREVEKNRKLAAELESVRSRFVQIQKEHAADADKLSDLQSKSVASEGERLPDARILEIQKQFNGILKELREEAERLKTSYPIFDLLSAKQVEVDRMKLALEAVPKEHPERQTIESMVKSHIRERDELQRIAQEADRRLQAQLDKIHASYLMGSKAIFSKQDSKQDKEKTKSAQWIRVPEF